MAVITVNPNVVKHTLPAAYYGFNFAAFFHQDAITASWRSAMDSIAPEILRAHMWGSSYDYTGHDNCKNGFAALTPEPKVSLQGDAFPAQVPATLAPNDPSNRATASNRSPSGVLNLIDEYRAVGLDVKWYEPYNEPSNCFDLVSPSNSGNEWYTSYQGYASGQGEQAVRRHAESWAVVHGRFWNQQVAAYRAAESLDMKLLWFTWGSSGNSSFNENSLKMFLDGTPLPNGQSNPNASPSNMPFFDVLVIHAYPGGIATGGDQGLINSYSYPIFADGRGSIYAMWARARQHLDSRGGTAKEINFNEGPSLPDNRAIGAFQDIILGLIACNYQAKFKLDQAVFHSANRGIVGDEGHSIFDPSVTPSTASMNTRGLVHRDMISPFMRLYKRQLIGGPLTPNPVSEITSVGTTPATAANNSVNRIICAAGKNAAGDKLGFLIVNLDLTSSESVTLQFGAVSNGTATFKQHDGSVAGNKTAPTSGTFPTNGNSSHTFTIAAGDAYFIEVPISAAGGDTTAPTLTAASVDGVNMTLNYSEALDQNSEPIASDYVILKNGVPTAITLLNVSGSTVQIVLTTPVISGDTITLSYTRVSGREIKDPAGNLAANLSGQAVTNNTPFVQITGRIVGLPRDTTVKRVIGGVKSGKGGGI